MDFNSNECSGRVGFTLSSDSVITLSKHLLAYTITNNIESFVVNSTGGSWAEDFSKLLIDSVSPYKPTYTTRPCTYYEHKWLSSNIKSSKLQVYIHPTTKGAEYLNMVFDCNNSPVLSNQLLNHKLESIYAVESSTTKDIIELEIDKYSEYLIDTKLYVPTRVKTINLFIDCMFGPVEYFFNTFVNTYPNSIRLFNRHSSPVRLLNYLDIPQGQFIKNFAQTSLQEDYDNLFFGVNNRGNHLGCYDLKQNVEISASSLILLAAYKFAKVDKRKGTILLTSITSSKVLEIIDHFDLEYEIIDCGSFALQDAINKKRKRPILFYANEYGCLWFKKDIPCPNPFVTILTLIELCAYMERSPGQIIDLINNNFLANNYYNVVITYLQDYLDFNKLETFILQEFELVHKYPNSLVYKSKFSDVRLAIKINYSYNRYEFYFDGTQENTVKKVSSFIETKANEECLNI